MYAGRNVYDEINVGSGEMCSWRRMKPKMKKCRPLRGPFIAKERSEDMEQVPASSQTSETEDEVDIVSSLSWT